MERLTLTINMRELSHNIRHNYRRAVKYNRSIINASLLPLYKTNINFKESILSDVIISIKRVEKETGMSISDLAGYFKKYAITYFFKNINGKKVPVNSTELINAYKELSSGNVKQAKKILYGI